MLCWAGTLAYDHPMTPEQYKDFKHHAVHELMALNKVCDEEFGIRNWERWDYDLDAGTLVFSESGTPKVVARIQVVGTTSATSNTWLWGWANNFPPGVTSEMRKVREFGTREAISQLTDSSVTNNEYLGWELTAIAARLLHAKGAYRCPRSDGGFLYLIYTEINFATGSEANEAESEPAQAIDCNLHGAGHATYVCEHLVADPKQQWFSDEPSPANPWPDAWCSRCDEAYQEQGEWNDNNSGFIKIKLLCHRCYESLRVQRTAY